jgi:predicted CxxxxCH...CXXCH cytochrome family protein
LILLAAFAVAAGCSTSTTTGGLVDASGNHPAGFVSTHPASARPDGSACKECHGSDLQGGIVKVSCFSASRSGVACHASGPAFHPANWVDTKARGTSGWHGGAFLGNVLINGVACSSCHTLGTSGTPGTGKCVTCHFTYTAAPVRRIPVGNPTVHNWSSSQTAGHSDPAFANDPVVNAVCVACHETNLRFANPPQVCHNCHAPFPSGHAAGWVAVPPAPQPHGAAAKAANGFPGCQACHGANFAGTASSGNVSCFNNAACHGATATWPHAPAPWRTSAGTTYTHTTTSETGNAGVCVLCHFPGSPNNPAGHPATPAPAGTPPGCSNNTLCHGSNGAPHPVPFDNSIHYNTTSTTFTGTFPPGCSDCHDVSAPTVKSGPVCQTCHVAASPLTALNCTSCHVNPPNGATTAYPNAAGAHAKHIALNSAGTPVTCNTCHNGLGTNTLNHYNRAKSRVAPGDAAFLATYNAQSGASSFLSGSLTCTNISCHGGTSPNWQTGAINVNTQCTICHSQGTAQFNSYNSGDHGANSDHSICTNCHNTTTLALNHFTSLSTTAMEGPASATIGGAGTFIPAGNYVAATRSCTPSCHGNETW